MLSSLIARGDGKKRKKKHLERRIHFTQVDKKVGKKRKSQNRDSSGDRQGATSLQVRKKSKEKKAKKGKSHAS